MIKLTEIIQLFGQKEAETSPIYFPANITVRVWNGKTIIDYNSHSYTVAESPEVVVRKIINYKATMIDFNNYSLGVVESLVKNDMEVYEDMRSEYKRILGYAGLEDEQ